MSRSRLHCSVLLLAAGIALVPSAVSAQDRSLTAADAAWLGRVLRIEDTRRDDAWLDSLLEYGAPQARARAALAAGRIGARAHVPALRRRAIDPDTAVAATSWFALALLRDSASVSAAATMTHAPATVAIEAVRLLGEVGEAGRPAIIAALADSLLLPRVRGDLLLAAARLHPIPAAAVAPWVSSSDTGVAWRAAYVLARGRSAAGVAALVAVARSPVGAVREQVARGLSRTVAGDSLGDTALAALRVLAVDREPRVRINAVRTLATYGVRASGDVVQALRDVDAGVRVVAAQVLGSVLDSSAAPWQAAFDADTAFVYQQAVAEGAAQHGVALAGARSWRMSNDWRRRAAAAGLAARGSAREAAPRLLEWTRDRDPRVRTAAVAAMAALIDSASVMEVAREHLRHALLDDDLFVRAAALTGLSRGATATDLTLALDAYARSRRDREADARLAFWQFTDSALARVGSTLPDTLERRVNALTRPTDPLERIAASHLPRFANWADSTGTPRDLAWYEARAREVIRRPTRTVSIATERGTLKLVLFASDAPLTVTSFTSLARRHYFDGQRFHRVVPNFVVQAGDPRGDGNGGPGYAIRDEINRHRYGAGTLGMALSGPNTGGSQFFVTHSPQPHLDGGYTVFGQLRAGESVLDRIVQGDRIVRIVVR